MANGYKSLRIRITYLVTKVSRRREVLSQDTLSFMYLLLVRGVGIGQVFVDTVHESLGSGLSLFVCLLLLSSLSLEETSLGLKG